MTEERDEVGRDPAVVTDGDPGSAARVDALAGPLPDPVAVDWAAEDEAANRCPRDGATGVDGSVPCACGRGAGSSRRDAPVLVDGEALASFAEAGRSAIRAAVVRAGLTAQQVAEMFDVPVVPVGMVYGRPAPGGPEHRERRDPVVPAPSVRLQWGWCHPEGRPVPARDEAAARSFAARVPGSSVHARLVGPWSEVDGG